MERRGKKERKKGEGARQKGKMKEGGSEKGKTEKRGKREGRGRGMEAGGPSIHLFTPQKSMMAWTGRSQSQEPGTQFSSYMWVAGARLSTGAIAAASQGLH